MVCFGCTTEGPVGQASTLAPASPGASVQPKPLQVSVEASCGDFEKLQHISQEVHVPVNSLLDLALCSDYSNDFEWDLPRIADQTVLEWVGHRFEAIERMEEDANDCSGFTGRPFKEDWTFSALENRGQGWFLP